MWCEIVGWLFCNGSSSAQLQTSSGDEAMMESIRSRTGSASALNSWDNPSASRSESEPSVSGAQRQSTRSETRIVLWGTGGNLALTDLDLCATLCIDRCQSSKEPSMSRLQLALNVSDLDQAIAFYSRYFDAEPAKVKPGYANFAIEDPPLKLVLIEGDQPGTINHLGVEVFSTGEVAAKADYLATQGLATQVEDQTTCCYAVQDKVWVDGPDGTSWETYVVLEDVETADACCSTGAPDTTRCC